MTLMRNEIDFINFILILVKFGKLKLLDEIKEEEGLPEMLGIMIQEN